MSSAFCLRNFQMTSGSKHFLCHLTHVGKKFVSVNLPIANGNGPSKPLVGTDSRVYYWAHGTTPGGAVCIIKDRRAKRTLESTMNGGPSYGFFGMATEDSSTESIQACMDKARSIGKGSYGLIVTGYLVSPVQHETAQAGGNPEDQEACYRSGMSHRRGAHWCMREDLCTVTGITVISSLPVEKQEHVPLLQPLSTDRARIAHRPLLRS